MSASDLISDFGQTVTITRYAAGTNVNGEYVAGAASTFDVVMSIQPLNGRDLLQLPEGQRTRNFLKGYCATELLTVNIPAGLKADLVTVAGKNYEVQGVEHWQFQESDIEPYWKVMLAEVNP